MNNAILSPEAQLYLEQNAKTSPSDIALRKSPFSDISSPALAEQVDARQRLASKLPSWLASQNIYYPPRRNAEQCSSEATARYKAQLYSGHKAIDLTGGFGVDVHAFSKQFTHVDYCEMDDVLFPIVEHNLRQLAPKQVRCHFGNSIDFLMSNESDYDLIYLDPARRDEHNRKMVGFADCVPNVMELQDVLFERSGVVMVKASPMMDITRGIHELRHVKAVHVVALKNECKELLFVLEKGFVGETEMITVNLTNEGQQTLCFSKEMEMDSYAPLGGIKEYLYEANSAILKAGAFNTVASAFGIDKLHASTHLYTSAKCISDFPGKTYKVLHNVEYNKKAIAKVLKDKKINVKTYNFSHTPQQVQKKLGLKDGGALFLFGVRTFDEKFRVLVAEKM